ncbi:MAG: 4-hydroxybenzoate polyprenyltransferase [Alphaproteobacteria bacterium]|jgi:4-hydroxybenzoate polyprenyltransferase
MHLKQNPYYQLMRLDKPIGIWFLLLPCLWGIWGAHSFLSIPISVGILFYQSILFTVGAIIMRSAGCVINDYFDRDFDKNVARTKNRPLADGTISTKNALILFVLLSCLGLFVLLQLSQATILIGCCVFIPIILYPLMKRITYFPQFFLGLVYNIGIIMGFVSISGVFDKQILWLYFSGVLITVAYDTIYAFQDIADDQKIGVKSSAIIWQNNPKIWIGLCYLSAFVCFSLFFQNRWIAFISILIIAILWAYLYKWDVKNHFQTKKFFKDHLKLLVLLLLIIISLMFSF